MPGTVFPFNVSLQNLIRMLPGARWSRTNKCWLVDEKPGAKDEILTLCEGRAWVDHSQLKENAKPQYGNWSAPAIIKLMQEKMELKRYSANSIKTYASAFRNFCNYFPEQDPANIDEDGIKEFMAHLVTQQKISSSYQNQCINAIKY